MSFLHSHDLHSEGSESNKRSSTTIATHDEPLSSFEFAESATPGSDEMKDQDHHEYLTGAKLITVVFALCLAVFCVALDNTV